MNMRKNDAEVTPIEGLEDDAVGATIVREELRLLGVVKAALEDAERLAKESVSQRSSDDARLLELRENVAAAKPEDLPSLFDQMHQIGALRAQRGRGSVGSIDGACPYFGHLRLVEDGKRRDVLIGARSYVDPRAAVKIVDWRNAPVSKIFYRYQEGDDYEEEIGDRVVEGQVALRRSVAIVNGVLVRVSSSEGTFVRARGSDRWSRVDTKRVRLATEKRWQGGKTEQGQGPKLGVGADGELRTDKHLPAIAALLDPDQFKLIAKPGSGVVAIQGGAGSGKTTVGLHRMAYLAFTDPQRFKPERLMAIVPNDALVHYVARVLPTLEVSGVPVMTFARWSSRVLAYLLTKIPLRQNESTPPVVARAKMHPAMLRVVDALHRKATADATRKLDEVFARGRQRDVLANAWKATGKRAGEERPLEVRLAAFNGWLAGKRELQGVAKAPDFGTVERMALDKAVHELRQTARNVALHWDEATTNRALLHEHFRGVQGFTQNQIDQVADWGTKQARIRAEGERDGDEPTIDTEDPALILRVWQVFRGPLTDIDGAPLRFAHLFVDEVQDANPVALRVLLELTGSDRSITLAGDVAQRTLEEDDDAERFDWVTLLEGLGIEAAALSPLKVSYRSTAEITDFARGVLGPLAHDEIPETTRSGPPVELLRFSSQGEAVAFLADALKQLHGDEPTANVALIARHAAQAEVYHQGLDRAEVPNVRIVTEQDFTWNAGFDVTDVRQTKGLEFDEVVLLDTNASSYPENALARRMLYVGATRAAHQLWCVASSEPSKLVVQALGEDPVAATP
jgi:DNA helicase II / ATP-dependent DNA helicase PcrA